MSTFCFEVNGVDNAELQSESGQSMFASEKKGRGTTRTCNFCQSRSLMCHSTPGQACTNCKTYGLACELNTGKRRGPPKGYIDALEKRLQKIEDTVRNSMSGHTSTDPLGHVPPQYAFPAKRIRHASSDSNQYIGELSPLYFFQDKLPLSKDCDIVKDGQRFRKFGQQIVASEEESDVSGHLNVPLIVDRPWGINHWIFTVTGADKHTSDRLLKIYFANIHPIIPIINKTVFLRQYRDQADTFPPADALNAMFGAAARFVECESMRQKQNSQLFVPPEAVWDVPPGWSEQFFYQAGQVISEYTEKPSISKVQAVILIHHHSGTLSTRSSEAWLMAGMAIRMAQALGLDRTCKDWNIPDDEKETRRRIWWALYIADRFQAACWGRPMAIREEDSDVEHINTMVLWREILDDPDPDEINPPMPRFPSATFRPKSIEGGAELYQLFFQLVKLSEILGRILQGLYSPRAKKVGYEQGSDAIVTRLDHELTVWRVEFPKALKSSNFDDFDETNGYFSPAIAFILQCYYSELILLHRPFIERCMTNDHEGRPSYYSFRISTSAAIRGIRIARGMSLRDYLMFPYFFALYPILQFSVIQTYNAKNGDASLASTARADLGAVYDLVKKLRDITTKAHRIYDLLRIVISKIDITMDIPSPSNAVYNESDPRALDNALNLTGINVDAVLHTMKIAEPVSQSFQPEPVASDTSYSASTTQVPAPLLTLNDTPQPLTTCLPQSTSASHSDYTSKSSPSSLTSVEAFTLKQFGFHTPGDPSQLDSTLQNISAFSELDAFPPLPIYGDEFGDLSSTSISITQHTTGQIENHGAPSIESVNPLFTDLPVNPRAQLEPPSSLYGNMTNFQPMVNSVSEPSTIAATENVFRNHPDNPFWSVPSSMDLAEWSEWNLRGQSAWKPS